MQPSCRNTSSKNGTPATMPCSLLTQLKCRRDSKDKLAPHSSRVTWPLKLPLLRQTRHNRSSACLPRAIPRRTSCTFAAGDALPRHVLGRLQPLPCWDSVMGRLESGVVTLVTLVAWCWGWEANSSSYLPRYPNGRGRRKFRRNAAPALSGRASDPSCIRSRVLSPDSARGCLLVHVS